MIAFLGVSFLRYKRISSRNTSFSIHVLKQQQKKKVSCIDIVSLVFLFFFDISLHGILWLYKHHDDSPRQNVLVGGPCGPSSFNLANVECVAIGECSKNVYNHLVYCKIGNESTLHWTVNLSYYLLKQVEGFLLDIANPRERFGHFKNYHIKSTFIFEAFLRQKGSPLKITVCLRHRYLFGTWWPCSNSRCSIPADVAMVAARKGTSSVPKAQCRLKKVDSTHVMSATNILKYLYK